ncbi:hypothetical protein Bcav_3655 [Beutenbergia cavernae DSM 12333]|uniref:LppM domain-containing protein n=2 Tax=Beutenbergia TaxID=84756 RepID=C5C3I8_BEUC1|nr:hypothetical protein Bcav_3655 [Beutenbergia cavernae DSM 12333]
MCHPDAMRRGMAVALIVLVSGLLTGCVRVIGDLRVSEADTVSGTLVIAVALVDDTDDAKERAAGQAREIENRLLPEIRQAQGVRSDAYRQGDYLGTQLTFSDTPLDVFSLTNVLPPPEAPADDAAEASEEPTAADVPLLITHEGDDYVVNAEIDPMVLDGAPRAEEGERPDGADSSRVSISISFPGDVESHNGELADRTVTWTTTYDEPLVMSARAGDARPEGPAYLWTVVVVALVGIVVLCTTALVLIGARSRGDSRAPRKPAVKMQ